MTASLEIRPRRVPLLAPRKAPASGWAVPFLYILLAAACAVFSHGFAEADETTHFLFARTAWYDWRMILSIWGRMGCTTMFALAAPFGVPAARLVAVGVTALTGWGTSLLLQQMVRGIGTRRAWTARHGVAIAWMLLFAQPCFAMNSFTVMTEMSLACCWVWAAVILMIGRQWRGMGGGGILLASLMMGLGGLMRPEGWIAIACWPVFVVIWMRAGVMPRALTGGSARMMVVLATLVAGAPPLFWYLLGVLGYQDWLWIIHLFPWSPKSQYGARAGQFLLGAISSMGIWMWWPILEGMWLIVRRRAAAPVRATRRRRAALLLLAVPLVGLFSMHGILGGFGLFGSMSLPRYFISIAPMAAVLAVMGLIHIERRIRYPLWKMLFKPALLLAAIWPLAALFYTGIMPTRANRVEREMEVVASTIESRLKPGEYLSHLMLGHPYIILRLGLPTGTAADLHIFDDGVMEHAAAGTMLVSEPGLWANEKHPSPDTLESWGWQVDGETLAKIERLKPQWEIQEMVQAPQAHVTLWVKQ